MTGFPRFDERDGVPEHHLVPGMELPEDEDDETGTDPDVLVYYDELARMAKRKRKKEMH